MEGDQKFTIDLSSQIDVNSHEMLVPAGQPKLMYNRQRFLGSILPSSVRFEDDGWFAGWLGHQFEFGSDGNNLYDGQPYDGLTIIKREDGDRELYTVIVDGSRFVFSPVEDLDVSSGTVKVNRLPDDDGVEVVGNTKLNGLSFDCTFDPYDLSIKTFNVDGVPVNVLPDGTIEGRPYKILISLDGNRIVFEIIRIATGNVVEYRKGDNVAYGSVDLLYSMAGGKSFWRNEDGGISFDNGAFAGIGSLVVKDSSIENAGTEDEVFNVTVHDLSVADYNVILTVLEKVIKGAFSSVTQNTFYLSAGSSSSTIIQRNEGYQRLSLVRSYPKKPSGQPVGYLQWEVPVWVMPRAAFSYSSVFTGNQQNPLYGSFSYTFDLSESEACVSGCLSSTPLSQNNNNPLDIRFVCGIGTKSYRVGYLGQTEQTSRNIDKLRFREKRTYRIFYVGGDVSTEWVSQYGGVIVESVVGYPDFRFTAPSPIVRNVTYDGNVVMSGGKYVYKTQDGSKTFTSDTYDGFKKSFSEGSVSYDAYADRPYEGTVADPTFVYTASDGGVVRSKTDSLTIDVSTTYSVAIQTPSRVEYYPGPSEGDFKDLVLFEKITEGKFADRVAILNASTVDTRDRQICTALLNSLPNDTCNFKVTRKEDVLGESFVDPSGDVIYRPGRESFDNAFEIRLDSNDDTKRSVTFDNLFPTISINGENNITSVIDGRQDVVANDFTFSSDGEDAAQTYKYHWEGTYYYDEVLILDSVVRGYSSSTVLYLDLACVCMNPASPLGTGFSFRVDGPGYKFSVFNSDVGDQMLSDMELQSFIGVCSIDIDSGEVTLPESTLSDFKSTRMFYYLPNCVTQGVGNLLNDLGFGNGGSNRNLISDDGSTLSFCVPFCVPALALFELSFNKVNTDEYTIIDSVVGSVSLRSVTNDDWNAATGQSIGDYVYRIDNGGFNDGNIPVDFENRVLFMMDTPTMSLTWVTGKQEAEITLNAIGTGEGFLYVPLVKNQKDSTEDDDPIVSVIYPAYVSTGNPSSSDGNMQASAVSSDAGLSAVVKYAVLTGSFIQALSFDKPVVDGYDTNFPSNVTYEIESPRYYRVNPFSEITWDDVAETYDPADVVLQPAKPYPLINVLSNENVSVYQKINVVVDAETSFSFYYDCSEEELVSVAGVSPFIVSSGKFDVVGFDFDDLSNRRNRKFVFTIAYKDDYVVDLVLKRALIISSTGLCNNMILVDYNSPVQTVFSDGTGNGSIDVSTTSAKFDNAAVQSIVFDGKKFILNVSQDDGVLFKYLSDGIIQRSFEGIKYVSHTSNTVTYTVDGVQHTVTIDPNSKAFIRYLVEDIRDDSLTQKEVYRRDISDVYMYIKQFWSNTVDIENYWWIDENHVLELSNAQLTLYQKDLDSPVDDWMGDRWIVEWVRNRSDWVTTDYTRYGVTCANKTVPVFYRIKGTDNSIIIEYCDVISQDTQWTTVTVPVKSVSIGNAFSSSEINSFTSVTGTSIVSVAKISSTKIGDYVIFGFAEGKGLRQWSVVINGTDFKVVTAYGYVGVDGTLTGGQIPYQFCTETGFNEPVLDIKELSNLVDDDAKIVIGEGGTVPSILPNKCYGNGVTVWFVTSKLTGIASHLVFSNGVYAPVELKLNCNVSEMYQAESFSSALLGDTIPQTLGIGDILGLLGTPSGLNNVINLVSGPLIYLDLTYATLTYINHSIGQYAYVWKNSPSEYAVKGKKTSKDVTFGKRFITQTFKDKTTSGVSKWIAVALKGIQNSTELAVDYFANNSNNQSPNEMAGPQFSEYFTDVVAGTVESVLSSSSNLITVKSTLTSMYSLDMFYSVSDSQQCFAGPGFVQHMFVGLCNARSATDKQLVGRRIGYFGVFTAISVALIDMTLLGLEKAQEILLNTAAGVGSAGGISNTGPALAGIATAAAAALSALIVAYKVARTLVEGLGETISGGQAGQSYEKGTLKDSKLSIEAPHYYGSRSLSFLYPCFGVTKPVEYTNEVVEACYNEDYTSLKFGCTSDLGDFGLVLFNNKQWTLSSNNPFVSDKFSGNVYSVEIRCRRSEDSGLVSAPINMAVVEGTTSFLPETTKGLKDVQIGVSDAAFAPPALHDFIVDKRWSLGYTAVGGEVVSVMQDDTKILDGLPSNVVVTDSFCGVASSYTAIEVKDVYEERYLRPWAITPNCIALNINRINCVQDGTAYHAFDGFGNRIVSWKGNAGMDKENIFQQYLFQINNHFKRSNIWPPSQFFGSFEGPPSVFMRTYDDVVNHYQCLQENINTVNNIPGELKDLQRFSIPVHSHLLSTLPAMVRMLQPYKLHVVEGVTSLCTDIRSTQTAYKAPTSIDFNINGIAYRVTQEFLCELQMKAGVVAVQDIVATQGLEFIGATTKVAYFYSPATRMYYSFTGGREITKNDVLYRFKDLKDGMWDFVNQEVMVKTLLTTNDVIVLRLDSVFSGEVYPPNETIYNERSGFKMLSMAGGTLFQGPKRFCVNRFVIVEYMYKGILDNKGRWGKLSRYEYLPERDYGWEYIDLENTVTPELLEDGTVTPDFKYPAVRGWTHNAFRFVTSMLGVGEEIDCQFEWSITFAWTDMLNKLFADNEYVTVNVRAETVTEGGVLFSEVTHIFLFRECFKRRETGEHSGYYTFQFQSNNGVGNRERLYLWCDGLLNVESIQLSVKQMTSRRTQPLNTQVDVQLLNEM